MVLLGIALIFTGIWWMERGFAYDTRNAHPIVTCSRVFCGVGSVIIGFSLVLH